MGNAGHDADNLTNDGDDTPSTAAEAMTASTAAKAMTASRAATTTTFLKAATTTTLLKAAATTTLLTAALATIASSAALATITSTAALTTMSSSAARARTSLTGGAGQRHIRLHRSCPFRQMPPSGDNIEEFNRDDDMIDLRTFNLVETDVGTTEASAVYVNGTGHPSRSRYAGCLDHHRQSRRRRHRHRCDRLHAALKRNHFHDTSPREAFPGGSRANQNSPLSAHTFFHGQPLCLPEGAAVHAALPGTRSVWGCGRSRAPGPDRAPPMLRRQDRGEASSSVPMPLDAEVAFKRILPRRHGPERSRESRVCRACRAETPSCFDALRTHRSR